MELFSPKKLLQALLCSYLLSAVLLLATAFFLYRFRLKESQIRLAVAVIYVLSGLPLVDGDDVKGIKQG